MKFVSVTSPIFIWAATLLIRASTTVLAHGILTQPQAEFDSSKMKTSNVTTIQANFPGKFDGSPDENAQAFTAAFKAQSTFKTLRDMLDPQGPDCGYTLINVSPKPIPSDGKVVWQNPDTQEGFVSSHTV